MDTSNIYRFNGEPFECWSLKDGVLRGYYPRNSLISYISSFKNGFAPSIKHPGTGWITMKVKVIGRSAFRGNTRFKSIHIFFGTKSIEDYAFDSVIPMKVYVPSSVKNIKNNAFSKNVTLLVAPDSYAERFAIKRGLQYRYHER